MPQPSHAIGITSLISVNYHTSSFCGLCSLASGHKIFEMTEENPPRSGKRRRIMAQATPAGLLLNDRLIDAVFDDKEAAQRPRRSPSRRRRSPAPD